MIKLIDDGLKFFKKYGFSQITFLERSGTKICLLKFDSANFGINRPR